MAAVERFAFATPLMLGLAVVVASARAEESARPARAPAGHVCLDQKERRTETTSGTVIRLAAAIQAAKNRMPGSVVGARLCHGQDALVYVLTFLSRDCKVSRIFFDVTKATLVGGC